VEELIGWDLFREEREGTLDLHYLLVKGGLEGRKCGRKGRRFFGCWLALWKFYVFDEFNLREEDYNYNTGRKAGTGGLNYSFRSLCECLFIDSFLKYRPLLRTIK